MVAINSAVAGIDPVEPAAITGAIGLARKPRGLGLDQRVAPRGRLHEPALVQHRGPGLARDLQKFQRELPVHIEHVGHQVVEPVP